MTTMQDSPTAAGSGANASENFKAKHRDDAGTSPERVSTVVTAVLQGVHAAIRAHGVTYPEFQAAKAWLMEVGEVGEWPLFMDVFVEHVVERR
jgi:Catechol dioxygenase N terminus.